MNLHQSVRRFALSSLTLSIASIVLGQMPALQHITQTTMVLDANEYPAFNSGLTAEEIIDTGSQFDAEHNTFVMPFHPAEEHPVGHADNPNISHEIRTLTYNSDAVILGTPILRKSALTSTHKFIFSDYEVHVDSIYASREILNAGQTLVVTRPGGSIQLNGRTVRAIETEYPLFHLNQLYLFFLHKTASGSYYVGPSNAYILNNGMVTPARSHPLSASNSLPLDYIVAEIHSADVERGASR